MRYLYQRGPGAKRRVMHLSGYDPRTGEPTMQPLCGRSNGLALQHDLQLSTRAADLQAVPRGDISRLLSA